MKHHKEVPKSFKQISPRNGSSYFSIAAELLIIFASESCFTINLYR